MFYKACSLVTEVSDMNTRMTGYDRALLELKTKNIELSSLVKDLLEKTISALSGKEELKDWRSADNAIDRVRDEIVNRCFAIMSLQQLRPQDLRWILGYQRIAQEMERVADYACDVAELNTLKTPGTWSKEIMLMANHLQKMFDYDEQFLRESREIEQDLDEQDDILDQTYAILQSDLVKTERDKSHDGDLAVSLVMGRTLERMGDHLVNIAEMVLFIKTGQRRLNKRS